MNWRPLFTLTAGNELRFNVQTEIEENINKKGYWKQRVVCLICYYGDYTMTEAWKYFNDELNVYKEPLMPIPDMPDNWIEMISKGIEENQTTNIGD